MLQYTERLTKPNYQKNKNNAKKTKNAVNLPTFSMQNNVKPFAIN